MFMRTKQFIEELVDLFVYNLYVCMATKKILF